MTPLRGNDDFESRDLAGAAHLARRDAFAAEPADPADFLCPDCGADHAPRDPEFCADRTRQWTPKWGLIPAGSTTHRHDAEQLIEAAERDHDVTLDPHTRGDLVNELELTLELLGERVLRLGKPNAEAAAG